MSRQRIVGIVAVLALAALTSPAAAEPGARALTVGAVTARGADPDRDADKAGHAPGHKGVLRMGIQSSIGDPLRGASKVVSRTLGLRVFCSRVPKLDKHGVLIAQRECRILR